MSILLPKYLYLNNNTYPNIIPKYLFQTYIDSKRVPQKVFDNIKKFASDYNYYFFDDHQAEQFLKEFYIPIVLQKFKELHGAHKADLLRYCLLYIFGGVYLDIKTILVKPLSSIFDHKSNNNYCFYSALSMIPSTIYQGILAVTPMNDIMKDNIICTLNTSLKQTKDNYNVFTGYMYESLSLRNSIPIINHGENLLKNNEKIKIFKEICCNHQSCPSLVKDRYGLNCRIIDEEGNIMFYTRFADFPW